MKEIPLNRGQVALADDADYDWLMQWKWHAKWCSSTRSFYAARSSTKGGKQVTIRMHRLILGLENGDKRNGDHINMMTLDNRRFNLRIATHSQNQHNSGARTHNKSGYKGVHFARGNGKWKAQIRLNGVTRYLGYFSSPEDAYAAYCEASRAMHGEFGRTR